MFLFVIVAQAKTRRLNAELAEVLWLSSCLRAFAVAFNNMKRFSLRGLCVERVLFTSSS